ncbi:hypothetical protein DFH27DRAFT_522792 [Peziza echinospora]|nr:hypothetical protein DFH27DRAFT_522792 [Peziza echinospora]
MIYDAESTVPNAVALAAPEGPTTASRSGGKLLRRAKSQLSSSLPIYTAPKSLPSCKHPDLNPPSTLPRPPPLRPCPLALHRARPRGPLDARPVPAYSQHPERTPTPVAPSPHPSQPSIHLSIHHHPPYHGAVAAAARTPCPRYRTHAIAQRPAERHSRADKAASARTRPRSTHDLTTTAQTPPPTRQPSSPGSQTDEQPEQLAGADTEGARLPHHDASCSCGIHRNQKPVTATSTTGLQ